MLKKYRHLIFDTLELLCLSTIFAVFMFNYYIYYVEVVAALVLLYYIAIIASENKILIVPGVGRKDGTRTPAWLFIRGIVLTAIVVALPYLAIKYL